MLINNATILLDDQKVLREKCAEVPLPLSKEDRDLLMDMMNYIRDSHDEKKAQDNNLRSAVGIAAPQIGVAKNLVAIGIPLEDEDLEYALVNPKIISNSKQRAYLKMGESCLSVNPDHQGIVPRYARITVKGYDILQEKEVTLRLRGYVAIVFQHEIDHLSGILYYDHIDKANPNKPLEDDALVIE